MQWIVLGIITIALILFIIGKPRYDVVSLISLLLLVLVGAVDADKAFEGFSQSAVVTVIAALVISAGLLKTGLLDYLLVHFNRHFKTTAMKIFSLMTLTALLSSFLNNVAALAMIMPMTLSVAKENKESPSIYLMPIATASLLGGLITKIGTPPNLLISNYREHIGMAAYQFFDFTGVGIALTFLGILFTATIGWRLIPQRKSHALDEDPYNIEEYISELQIPDDSTLVGTTIRSLVADNQLDINVLSIIRHGIHISAPSATECLMENDLLMIKAEHGELNKLMEKTGLKLKYLDPKTILEDRLIEDSAVKLVEIVLKSDSPLIGHDVIELNFRNTYDANLVAVSRQGTPSVNRLKYYRFQAGDVLLLLIGDSTLKATCQRMRAVPLSFRDISYKPPMAKWKKLASVVAFLIAILFNVAGVLPIQVCFLATALFYILIGILSVKESYDAIEWPIVAMLGSLIPMGTALENSGAADLIASGLLSIAQGQSPLFALMLTMTVTVLLTNLVNNSAAVMIMAPIGVALSQYLNLSLDPFLMGICVGASSAYMTPIGHQSNTLVMGPGGYRFMDYWKFGLPLSIITILAGAPLIALVWPF